MNQVDQAEINKIVWRACESFRGIIDPAQYKNYVLTMLFVKYVSEIHRLKYKEYFDRYEGDNDRIVRAMNRERFVVPIECSFDYLFEHRNDSNIGDLINGALIKLQKANWNKMSGEDGHGLFSNVDFTNTCLGDLKERNARLQDLLQVFSNGKMRLSESDAGYGNVFAEAYQYFLSVYAGQIGKKSKDFYTPAEVSSLLVGLAGLQPGARICDPASGTGSLLIAASKEIRGGNFSLYGQEIDGDTWYLAKLNMFLNDLDDAVIRWGDTLLLPKLKDGNELMTFDTVLSHPTFSLDNWGAGELADDPYHRFDRGIPPESKADWAFISHMLKVADENHGKVVTIVPMGVLFRGANEVKIRKQTVMENILEAVIGLPANLFYGAGVAAAILIFNKRKEEKNVLFINASGKEYFEAGKSQNKLLRGAVARIVSLYNSFTAGKLKEGLIENKFAYTATYSEIEGNEFNLNISKYVNTLEDVKDIDPDDLQNEISMLEDELTGVRTRINMFLNELGLKIR